MPEFSQLLEIAQENGLNILSQADLEEVGPVDAVQIAPIQAEVRAAYAHIRHRPQTGINSTVKLYLQLFICLAIVFLQSDHGKQLRRWLRPLPVCAELSWWQMPLDWAGVGPGSQGECRLK
jgi:hypothetical protein